MLYCIRYVESIEIRKTTSREQNATFVKSLYRWCDMQYMKIDERIQGEINKIMADLFYVQLLFIVMAVAAQLFVDRSFIHFFLPL